MGICFLHDSCMFRACSLHVSYMLVGDEGEHTLGSDRRPGASASASKAALWRSGSAQSFLAFSMKCHTAPVQGEGALGSPGDQLRLALVWLLTSEQAPSEADCAQVEAALAGAPSLAGACAGWGLAVSVAAL